MAWYGFAALNVAIALAYVTIGLRVVPKLRIRREGRVFGMLFFATCALTHSDLAYHAIVTRPAFFLEAHMWGTHAVQAVVDWGFIYMVLIRPRRPHRLRTPLAEAAGLSEVALANPDPAVLRALHASLQRAIREYDSIEERWGGDVPERPAVGTG